MKTLSHLYLSTGDPLRRPCSRVITGRAVWNVCWGSRGHRPQAPPALSPHHTSAPAPIRACGPHSSLERDSLLIRILVWVMHTPEVHAVLIPKTFSTMVKTCLGQPHPILKCVRSPATSLHPFLFFTNKQGLLIWKRGKKKGRGRQRFFNFYWKSAGSTCWFIAQMAAMAGVGSGRS